MTVVSDEVAEAIRRIDLTAGAHSIARDIAASCDGLTPDAAWKVVCSLVLTPDVDFSIHLAIHEALFATWDDRAGPAPVWFPDESQSAASNIGQLMSERGLANYGQLHRWSIEHRSEFWRCMIEHLRIRFVSKPRRIVEDEREVETPRWLPDATMNIADSCFQQDRDRVAVVHGEEVGDLKTLSVGDLESLTNRVANGLIKAGFNPGDAIAIDLPMTVESVAIYLGIIRAGCVVVSIADSFAPAEIATRIRIAQAKGIFTQDVIRRAGKSLPLYQKVVDAACPRVIVVPADSECVVRLRSDDMLWNDFLSTDSVADSVACDPGDPCNILFSSGTTGDPKAIPWSHSTPIKCAADGWLHQDIRTGDVVAWPTNLGWMMGPWLIYASLINGATIALYEGAPNTRGFCEFVQYAGVTMLGIVPSLVKAWRLNDMVNGSDWSSIRCFSSTGECSNAEDMFWLMSRAGYRPVIEYCGGTEIGGGYITGTMVQPAAPATFSTPALGLDVVILNDQGREAETGELFIVPPSIGLSTSLLNRNHREVYFDGTPASPTGQKLRRHGDEMSRMGGGYFQALGRADDTMNLGGIKVSSAEIERVANTVADVQETAAIAVPPPGGGPDLLVLFVVGEPGAELIADQLRARIHDAIKRDLNPLFRVHEACLVDSLPRTASNKVMRRTLRANYQAEQS